MTTSIQAARPPMPARKPEPVCNRPLPKGVLAVGQSQPAPNAALSDRVPEGTLIVGRDIHVKGEIEDCRALIVEGRVEATLKTDRLEVRKGGIFVGSAEAGQAIVAGTVEGSLTVSGLLEVSEGGQVRGDTRYGRISIKTGGVIAGSVEVAEDAEHASQPLSLAGAGS